jgi:pimeloyl-ACP methyl ester carboxylesterase
MNAGSVRNAVLVHGGFVDGSGWQGVYDLLKQNGYNVAVVQHPTLSLEGDVAATRQVIDAQDGPGVLVGHSYDGAAALGGSITEPAWRVKPSWYLVATEDRMIPPPAQRVMSERAGSTVVEAAGSHSIYVSQPGAVAALIEQAARKASDAEP